MAIVQKDNNVAYWTIEDFHTLDRTVGVSVESPVYHDLRGDIRADWQLVVYPGGVGTAKACDTLQTRLCNHGYNNDSVSVYLKLVRCNYVAVAAKFKITLEPVDQLYKDCTEYTKFATMGKTNRWGWQYMHTCWDRCSHGNAYTLKKAIEKPVTIEVSCYIYSLKADGERLDMMPNPNVVIDQLRSFYEQGKLTDFDIVVGTKVFRVHKALLAARSPVISAMFDHQTRENAMNLLEIPDFSPETVEEFIRVLYTGDSNGLRLEAFELLAMAEKYDVKFLKAECEVALATNLTVQNATTVLELADLHRAKHLKRVTLEFFKQNIRAIKADTAKWDSLSRTLVDDFIDSAFPAPTYS